ncbi:cytochrome-c peroxidase [Dokdonia sp. Asnod1-B02]|uniref:cytochrome-c peroxidase n=1 Tax=Dokdonia sp. Asnod1-B02 TaxID=3160573 RepID=UPI0038689232
MKNIVIKQLLILIVIAVALLYSCKGDTEKYTSTPEVNWEASREIYLNELNKAIAGIDTLKQLPVTDLKAKEVFKTLRIAFKKAEPYASYLNPPVGHRVNGPALPIYKEDNEKTMNPVGLQKIEESIYEGETSQGQYDKELTVTYGLLQNLKKNIEKRELNASRYFTATHQQLLRVLSFSIAGFDTPVSQLGINEGAVSLQNLHDTYHASIQSIIQAKDEALDKQFTSQINQAIAFINENSDYDTFDRYSFTRNHLTPITRSWVAIRKASELWEGNQSTPFNFDAPTFFDDDSFNVNFFTPSINKNPTDEQITLGKKLFFDEKLSTSGTMACATCHDPKKAYTDGLVTNKSNTGEALQRNTPTLLNTIFQQNFFADGRSGSIIDQVSSVFTNKKEFDTNVHKFSKRILEDSSYLEMFEKAYGGVSTRNTDVVKAISSYVSTLNSFDSKFDRNMRGDEDTFTKEEQRGMNLFMGKALCATCHFMPLTNGTVPPFFAETEREVIGVPETAENKELDDDTGYYWRFEAEQHKGMFKTPTVRNAALTAPYMHNGVYTTLEQVMDFYNQGGGGGLGFDLPHQTLPFDNLKLTDEELASLTAFVKTLTDDKVEDNY